LRLIESSETNIMETTFASYQQPQPHSAHHPQGHIQGAYPPNQNGNPQITSPSQQNIHPPPSQTSPLMSQGNPYGQHPGQNPPGHHQQLPYNAGGYGVQGMPGYNLSASQAAAMATAAASGSHYYGMWELPST
jgi:nuclear transcription factor Y alpha